jgi:hypothetical protein
MKASLFLNESPGRLGAENHMPDRRHAAAIYRGLSFINASIFRASKYRHRSQGNKRRGSHAILVTKELF